ncbi:MAG: exosome complex RNA-binding protein Csl4 [Pyrobaculum sp.]
MRRVVAPGELVASAEEFEVKGAVYVQNYDYIAAVTGVAMCERKSHLCFVKPFRSPHMPKTGSVVYCQVVGKGRRGYLLRCFATEGDKGVEEFKYFYTATTPYFFSDGELGVGDYIRGRVVSTYGPPFVVSIRGHTYGSVLSRCPRCGSVLKRKGSVLQCISCGTEVRRKIAIGYYTV